MGFTCHWIAADDRGAHLGIAGGGFEFAGHAGEEAIEHQLFFDTDHRVIRAAHAHVGLVGSASGEDALIRGGDVGVGAQDGGYTPIEIPAHGDFFAGGFGVKIHQDDLCFACLFDTFKDAVDLVEWVVGAVHEDAAHDVDDCVGCADVLAVLDHSLVDAVAGQAVLQVGGAQDAASALMALFGSRLHVLDQLFLVPDVVAGGDDVGAKVEEFFSERGRDAEAAGGVFAVDDGEVDLVAFAHMRQMFADDPAPGTSEDITYEEDFHEEASVKCRV